MVSIEGNMDLGGSLLRLSFAFRNFCLLHPSEPTLGAYSASANDDANRQDLARLWYNFLGIHVFCRQAANG